MASAEPIIKLDTLEGILLRENSIISECDVYILMEVLYKELGYPVPEHITEECDSFRDYAAQEI